MPALRLRRRQDTAEDERKNRRRRRIRQFLSTIRARIEEACEAAENIDELMGLVVQTLSFLEQNEVLQDLPYGARRRLRLFRKWIESAREKGESALKACDRFKKFVEGIDTALKPKSLRQRLVQKAVDELLRLADSVFPGVPLPLKGTAFLVIVTVTPILAALFWPNGVAVASVRILPSYSDPPKVGDTWPLDVDVTDEDGEILRDPEVEWECSDPLVATVSQKGEVKALQPGTVEIRVKCDEKSDTITLTIPWRRLERGFDRGRPVLDPKGMYWEKYQATNDLPGFYLYLKDRAHLLTGFRAPFQLDYLHLDPHEGFELHEGERIFQGVWTATDKYVDLCLSREVEHAGDSQ